MEQQIFSNVRIETQRLILRCFNNNDKEEFYQIIQDPKLYKTLPEDHMYNHDETNEIIDWFIERYEKNSINDLQKFPLAITLKDDGRIIGDIGIGHYSNDHSVIEIFYFINSKYWNQHFVSEAGEAFLEYVRIHKMVKRLIGTVVIGNIASSKILVKNGFTRITNHYNDDREMFELLFN